MSSEKSQNAEGKYCYRYPHAALTADCVIFGFDGRALKVLLVERGLEPYKGMWAIPGGFMKMDETIDQTAIRELREETGLINVYMEQFKVYSRVDRDPRERVVTVAFIALVRPAEYILTAGDDAANAMWFDEQMLPPLAFDHAEIIRDAREHLSEILRIKPIAFRLLNKYFSLSELQRVYEAINRTEYDRRNFQRKVLQTGMLREIQPEAPDEMDCSTCGATAPKPKSSSLGQRTSRRFFSFFPSKKMKSENDSDDNSTKDIFNF